MNEQDFREWFALSDDIIIKTYPVTYGEMTERVTMLYCEGMVRTDMINGLVLPKMQAFVESDFNRNEDAMDVSSMLQLVQLTGNQMISDMKLAVYAGQLILFFENTQAIYAMDIAAPPNRSPEESSTETSIKGPRDGFTEEVITNIALVRKRLATPSLCCEKIHLGRKSNTVVALLYLGDVINESIIQEARDRLQTINVDAVISSAQLNDALSGRAFSLFPLLNYTGRPDFVADSLLRGRFAVIVDGSPMALIAPASLSFILDSPEDVHNPFYFVAFERILRVLGLLISVLLPGLWISVSSFNLDQIPYQLVATISSSRLGLPLSGPMDFIVMLMLFELFREAGARLPKVVGQTVTVVGGLIVGDAAIRSGITSPTTLVVTSLSTISMYTLVNQSLAGTITVLRIVILLISTVFGIYGFMISLMGLILFMSTLESFGVPYLSPLSPPQFGEMITSLLAKPWKKLRRRPHALSPKDDTRQGGGPS
ncbi:Spore germination protein XA [Paenibacillus allorhizoplanae]|uniref:Spore germination protein XA n=1 Tax=Paenibacillus allorhizoplanae TaxID=2905648 RepID=A0ABN8H912_9BACL|nr:spore germination protein [Paenibacillus allorhizoplanae]CAH1224706.1 Spore germination protein XA [Paenibacillus allorhizoplanae]